jgi:glycosyltransferase involved in cell wall biosynthesis
MSEATPLVTFIVPCYNYARYLPDCLGSILRQEGSFDFEIILIDDASTDDTAEVIASCRDPRVRAFTHAVNVGHAGTISEGLRLARGEYVARIDPDDRYRTDYLARVIPVFEAHPEVGLVYGDVALIDERGTITAERCDRVHGGRDYKGNELVALLGQNFICAPSVMARRAAWLKALPVPEWLAFNDWYFTLSMAREYEFYYLDAVLADYRVHGTNHHSRIVLNKTEEPSVFWLLDKVYSTPEESPELEAAKRRARGRVYGAQYLDMADKYFGCGYTADARRCYLKAVSRRPTYLLDAGVLRRLLATLIGLRAYESSKAAVKAIVSPPARERR